MSRQYFAPLLCICIGAACQGREALAWSLKWWKPTSDKVAKKTPQAAAVLSEALLGKAGLSLDWQSKLNCGAVRKVYLREKNLYVESSLASLSCVDLRTGWLRWTVKLRRPLRFPPLEMAEPLLHVEDIVSWHGLCSRLRERGADSRPSPSKRIWELLSPTLRKAVASAAKGKEPTENRKLAIIQALNEGLVSRTFYDKKQFAGVDMPDEAASLLKRKLDALSAKEVQRLNRLLLDASYPQEIVKSDRTGYLTKNHFLIRETATGVQFKTIRMPSLDPITPLAYRGKAVFGSTSDNRIFKVCLDMGKNIWNIGLGKHLNPMLYRPLCHHNAVVYISEDDGGTVHCVSGETGVETWFLTAKVDLTPPVAAGDRVLAGSAEGILYAIDVKSGAVKWQFTAEKPLFDPPQVVGGRTVFLPCRQHGIYAITLVKIPVALSVEHVVDWLGFCSNLNRDRREEEPNPGKRIWELLPKPIQTVVAVGAQEGKLNKGRRSEIVEALNKVLKQKDFYQEESFPDAVVPEKAKQLLRRDRDRLSAADVQKLNRFLLEAAYPQEVVKSLAEGERKWWAAGERVRLLAMGKRRAYLGFNEESIVAVDAETGKPVWQLVPEKHTLFTSNLRSSILYLASPQGDLVALKEE